MNVEILVLVLIETIILLAVYTYLAYRFLNVKQLITHYKRAYSLMGEKSGDSKRTKMLEDALVTGIIKDENPLLAAGIDYATEILENEGIEVETSDLMLLYNSPQVQKMIEPLLSKVQSKIDATMGSPASTESESGRYELKHPR